MPADAAAKKVVKKEKPAAAVKKPQAKTAKAKKEAKPVVAPKEAPKKSILKFVIDCKAPVEDGIFQMADFALFIEERFKINGKKGKHQALTIEAVKHRLNVSTVDHPFSKKYMKNYLRDWLRVVNPNNAKDTYELRYFNINNE